MGRIRSCGFVEGDLSFGVGFQVSKAHARPSHCLLCLLPVDQNIKLSATVPVPCLSAFCHADNGLTLKLPSSPQLNALFYKSCLGHVCLHSNRTVVRQELCRKCTLISSPYTAESGSECTLFGAKHQRHCLPALTPVIPLPHYEALDLACFTAFNF